MSASGEGGARGAPAASREEQPSGGQESSHPTSSPAHLLPRDCALDLFIPFPGGSERPLDRQNHLRLTLGFETRRGRVGFSSLHYFGCTHVFNPGAQG